MPLADFNFQGKIGEGMYGNVFQATRTGGHPDEKFAVKQFKRFRTDDGISPSAIREIKLLREIQHPRIVELVEVEFDRDLRLHLVKPPLRPPKYL